MIVLNLVHLPNHFSQPVIEQLLTPSDIVLLTAATLSLAFQSNFYLASGVIRASDAQLLPGKFHSDWRIVDDQEWANILTNAEKVIAW